MTTDCNIVLETPVPHADERTHVLAGEPLVGDKKVLTEVINEESELAKKCGAVSISRNGARNRLMCRTVTASPSRQASAWIFPPTKEFLDESVCRCRTA